MILKKFKKIIFTDVDLIFNEDPYFLNLIDLENKCLAACKDLIWTAFVNVPEEDWSNYSSSVLHLKNKYDYVNTGVMIYDIDKMNRINFSEQILDIMSKNNFRILEQDGINYFFNGDIKYIDSSWNFPIESIEYKKLHHYMPQSFQDKYISDKNNKKIIHWAGKQKPWLDLSLDFFDLWWKYARQTPFYEEILSRLIDFKIKNFEVFSNQKNNNEKLLYVLNHNFSFLIKKYRLKFLKHITFGKKHQKYKKKYKSVKMLLKEAKKYKKNILKI